MKLSESYLAIENSALLVDLQLIIVVHSKSLEENLILIRCHGALASCQYPALWREDEMSYLQLQFSFCITHTTLQHHVPESSVVEIVDMACKYSIS